MALASMPRFLLVRSPITAFTRLSSTPQRSRSSASLSCDCSRTRTCTVPPRASSFSTRKRPRSEEHTSELQSRPHLVCRLLLEKKKNQTNKHNSKVTLNTQLTQHNPLYNTTH